MEKPVINTTIQQAIHSPGMVETLPCSSSEATNIHDFLVLLEQHHQLIEEQNRRIHILEEYLYLERTKRLGLDITHASMTNWVRLAVELQLIIHLMQEHQSQYGYLQINETCTQLLMEPEKSTQSQKR